MSKSGERNSREAGTHRLCLTFQGDQRLPGKTKILFARARVGAGDRGKPRGGSEGGGFYGVGSRAIARSLKRSADRRGCRKAPPFRSTMSYGGVLHPPLRQEPAPGSVAPIWNKSRENCASGMRRTSAPGSPARNETRGIAPGGIFRRPASVRTPARVAGFHPTCRGRTRGA